MVVLTPDSCSPFSPYSKDMLIDFASEQENIGKITRECCNKNKKSQPPLTPRGMDRLSGALRAELPETYSRTDKEGI